MIKIPKHKLKIWCYSGGITLVTFAQHMSVYVISIKCNKTPVSTTVQHNSTQHTMTQNWILQAGIFWGHMPKQAARDFLS
jgi:hypothetical protein